MPQINISSASLQFIIAIGTVITMVVSGVFWVTEKVATKEDIAEVEQSLSKQSKLQHIDVSIRVSETSMLIYESRIDSLTPAEQRQYDLVKSIHAKQVASYKELTDGL